MRGQGHITRRFSRSVTRFSLCALLLVSAVLTPPAAAERAIEPLGASITVRGSGAKAGALISLSTGPTQKIQVTADKKGEFLFSNLLYKPSKKLIFTLNIPGMKKGDAQIPENQLTFNLSPSSSRAKIEGKLSKGGSIALNVDGARKPFFQVAGEEGYISLSAYSASKIADGSSQMIASIINTSEKCCPHITVPTPPITLIISSLPIAAQQAVPPTTAATKSTAHIVPVAPDNIPKTTPILAPKTTPSKSTPYLYTPPSPEDANAPKPPAQSKPGNKRGPYIIQGSVTQSYQMTTGQAAYAASVSFPSSTYEDTYVGGFRKMTDSIRKVVVMNGVMLAALLDGRDAMNALRALQTETTDSLVNMTPSIGVCRFGTLSRSLAASEEKVTTNKLGFVKIMQDRTDRVQNGLYADYMTGIAQIMTEFQKQYCEPSDNNNALAEYCIISGATADLFYNRDIDFTRVFDVPLTLDADFSSPGAAPTNNEESLIALFENLSFIPTSHKTGSEALISDTPQLQDFRAATAARSVAANSYATLVAQKTKGTTGSATYMQNVLTSMGLSAANATALVGANPSYFAQMEILTKKIFEDPKFYAGLYESPANVARQKVAVKAIELMQNRDYYETLRRREMLLSSLLELKLRYEQGQAVQDSTRSSAN